MGKEETEPVYSFKYTGAEVNSNNVIKSKLRPTTGHESPESELRYSSTLSLTSALDGGGTLSPFGRFTPGKGT